MLNPDFLGAAHPAGLFPALLQLIQFLFKRHFLFLSVLQFAVDPVWAKRGRSCCCMTRPIVFLMSSKCPCKKWRRFCLSERGGERDRNIQEQAACLLLQNNCLY